MSVRCTSWSSEPRLESPDAHGLPASIWDSVDLAGEIVLTGLFVCLNHDLPELIYVSDLAGSLRFDK